MDQLKIALLISWLVISTLIFPILLAPFVLAPETIFALAPRCEMARDGRECPACGMTASFVLLAQGRLDAAVSRNTAGILLYSALVWNECVAVWYALGELSRTWKRALRNRQRVPAEDVTCRS